MWQAIAMPSQSVSADICLKLVDAATRQCPPVPVAPPAPVNPNWDAIAASFASLSTAFAWGSIILAAIAVIAAFAWGRLVTASAEKEAKAIAKNVAEDVAKNCADAYIAEWLAKQAPGIIRERVDFIMNATLGPGNDSKAADDIGKEA
jgi:hypothetical protein